MHVTNLILTTSAPKRRTKVYHGMESSITNKLAKQNAKKYPEGMARLVQTMSRLSFKGGDNATRA